MNTILTIKSSIYLLAEANSVFLLFNGQAYQSYGEENANMTRVTPYNRGVLSDQFWRGRHPLK